MARHVFFSFHYEKDILRVGQIRNSGLTKPDMKSAGFIDSASWESIRRQGDEAIERWINTQLQGTSVTVVLIGPETSERDWVQYEIQKSYARGNGMLGIFIHKVRDLNGHTAIKGQNPFDLLYLEDNGKKTYLSNLYRSYDWVDDDGYSNFGKWVEKAAQDAGKL